MFKSRTVFIIGAGASEEVGLPIGKELTTKIAQLVDLHVDVTGITRGDWQIYEILKREVNAHPEIWADNKLLVSARHISEAMEMATSIDTFLESFSTDQERIFVAKLGIAKAIITAEQASKFASRDNKPFRLRSVADTWYVSLAQLLFSGVPAATPEVAFHNVSFIVFNYDRCIQVFLARALQSYFQIEEGRASDILRNVTFLHPYGNLGGVFPGDKSQVPYGTERYDLLQLAGGINTFSESVKDPAIIDAAREQVMKAETLVFLGFAFHDQNMALMSTVDMGTATKRVLATTFGLSASDTDIVRNLIGGMLSGRPVGPGTPYTVTTFGGKCAPFFAEYWRSLTAS
jgi:hypothetical protein